MVFAVAALERLGHALDTVDDVEAGDEVHIEAEDRLIIALGDVDVQAKIFQPADELVTALLGDAVLQDYDHNVILLIFRKLFIS